VYQLSRQLDSPFLLYGITFIPGRKEEKEKENKKKNEETKPIFESSYLRKTWHNLVEIWNVGYRW